MTKRWWNREEFLTGVFSWQLRVRSACVVARHGWSCNSSSVYYPNSRTGLHETGRSHAHHTRSTIPESAACFPGTPFPHDSTLTTMRSSGPGSILGSMGVAHPNGGARPIRLPMTMMP
ncbi:hypothetical protein LY78DRAFT_358075 [Colletotrichum sublineola]|nr:hypothetical protein LY78DRAFT_358075 [Colletotrichum sublineola]